MTPSLTSGSSARRSQNPSQRQQRSPSPPGGESKEVRRDDRQSGEFGSRGVLAHEQVLGADEKGQKQTRRRREDGAVNRPRRPLRGRRGSPVLPLHVVRVPPYRIQTRNGNKMEAPSSSGWRGWARPSFKLQQWPQGKVQGRDPWTASENPARSKDKHGANVLAANMPPSLPPPCPSMS